MEGTTSFEQMTVPLSRLVHDPANVRKRDDKASIESMKATILASGLAQPLAVRPPVAGDADLGGQLYRVFAGGRRLRAMNELVAEQKLTPDYPVPIIVRDVDDRDANALSLTENLIRSSMSPVDEFRAFQELFEKDMTVPDIALHFGQTERFVRGRLALAGLHPEILAAFEADKLSFAAVTAYTLSANKEEQLAAYNALAWQKNNPFNIKAYLSRETISADSKIAGLIGEERYRAAGGDVVEDLFGEEVRWTSVDVIARLQREMVDEAKAAALADGWSFAETIEEYGGNYWELKTLSKVEMPISAEDEARLSELGEILDAAEGMDEEDPEYEKIAAASAEYDTIEARRYQYTPEQKASAGVVIMLDRGEIRYGVLRPGAKPVTGAGSSAKVERDPLALTAPVLADLSNAVTTTVAEQVKAKPHLALALLAAQLQLTGTGTYGVASPTRLKLERSPGMYSASDKTKDFTTLFKSYATKSPEDLLLAIADRVAGIIDLTDAWFAANAVDPKLADKLRILLLEQFEADPTPHFDAKAFFDGSRKPVIEAAMREMTGHLSAFAKKGDMAREAAEFAKATGWLPKPLRTKNYKLNKPKEEKPAKAKARPKKAA